MDRYQTFANWLKSQNLVSAPSAYPKYLGKIESMMNLQLHDVRNIARLEAYYAEVQGKRTFQALPQHERRNLLSGFTSYIDFVRYTKGIQAA
ncbi:hypothetical protein V9K67_21710 [Paraflavisolibacter sp. H34]|uniref:hypothetical protein n=1 Tax=Huijunlia imazamoxiresistens TaxID=3127457 RepID=UPI0030172AD1